jgi:hypothetical protein
MRIIIVGADASKWTDTISAMNKIREILDHHYIVPMPELGSGRSPKGGIDVWVEQINDKEYHYPFTAFPPVHNSWYWYKKRNIMMAEWCDLLYCISVRNIWDGGRWTANHARQIGKTVQIIEI